MNLRSDIIGLFDLSQDTLLVHGWFSGRTLTCHREAWVCFPAHVPTVSFSPATGRPGFVFQPLHPVSPWGFPGSSVGERSACIAGDPGSISGLGGSPVEGNGYPLQYS